MHMLWGKLICPVEHLEVLLNLLWLLASKMKRFFYLVSYCGSHSILELLNALQFHATQKTALGLSLSMRGNEESSQRKLFCHWLVFAPICPPVGLQVALQLLCYYNGTAEVDRAALCIMCIPHAHHNWWKWNTLYVTLSVKARLKSQIMR